jgi:hypothetical protein
MMIAPWGQIFLQESPRKKVSEIIVQAIRWPDPFTCTAIRILTRNNMRTENFVEKFSDNVCHL